MNLDEVGMLLPMNYADYYCLLSALLLCTLLLTYYYYYCLLSALLLCGMCNDELLKSLKIC